MTREDYVDGLEMNTLPPCILALSENLPLINSSQHKPQKNLHPTKTSADPNPMPSTQAPHTGRRRLANSRAFYRHTRSSKSKPSKAPYIPINARSPPNHPEPLKISLTPHHLPNHTPHPKSFPPLLSHNPINNKITTNPTYPPAHVHSNPNYSIHRSTVPAPRGNT
ncbi:hypothetical protein EJ04DRAFT_516940 [Polyplosphaeria fusca]|uniref:Uncharacterized protein n=1 Tax=Polyplosphaeria fusca TaxID=682080 RepID=A0A9P4QIH7_9PLEO|nr:hypothetical protein EJ04DRAFT_516940 [Polyplosphaeria fusca]